MPHARDTFCTLPSAADTEMTAQPAQALGPVRRQWLALAGWSLAAGTALGLAGCGSSPKTRPATTVAPRPALALPGEHREALLARAMLVVNTRYTYGGNTPEGGFDCSGLIQYAVGGVSTQRLPRTTAQWAAASSPVALGNLQRGDFVFFNTSGARHSHMGIFVGGGQFVHAPSTGGTVQRVRMDNPYFAKRFTEARSVFVD